MNPSTDGIVIVAVGANTPVGRGAWSSCAAVRAGISGFGEHPYMLDSCGEPMRAGLAPWLDIDLRGTDRLEALLLPAVGEALDAFAATAPLPRRIRCHLALPSPRPGLGQGLEEDLSKRLARSFGGALGELRTYPHGHAGALLAVEDARSKLASGELDACVVAAADSYADPTTLEWLESCDQLHGAGLMNNAWGFVPGEAAGAIVLVRADAARAAGLHPLATLLGVGIAMERNLIKTETVCLGEGLTLAIRSAFETLPVGLRVSDVFCDMNGEPYRADEFGFACLRTGDRFVSPSDFVAPADCWGDVGAAGAVLHLMLAVVAGLKGYACGKEALVWASSETGPRAAAVISTLKGH